MFTLGKSCRKGGVLAVPLIFSLAAAFVPRELEIVIASERDVFIATESKVPPSAASRRALRLGREFAHFSLI